LGYPLGYCKGGKQQGGISRGRKHFRQELAGSSLVHTLPLCSTVNDGRPAQNRFYDFGGVLCVFPVQIAAWGHEGLGKLHCIGAAKVSSFALYAMQD